MGLKANQRLSHKLKKLSSAIIKIQFSVYYQNISLFL